MTVGYRQIIFARGISGRGLVIGQCGVAPTRSHEPAANQFDSGADHYAPLV